MRWSGKAVSIVLRAGNYYSPLEIILLALFPCDTFQSILWLSLSCDVSTSLCPLQPCSPDTPSFREELCASYNSDGLKYRPLQEGMLVAIWDVSVRLSSLLET